MTEEIVNSLIDPLAHRIASSFLFWAIKFGILKSIELSTPNPIKIPINPAKEIAKEYKPNSSLVNILVKKIVNINELALKIKKIKDLKLKFRVKSLLVCVEKNIL